MLHIYRQITGLRRWETFVITRERQSEELFPMPPGGVEIAPKVRSHFIRRFWLKHIRREPPIVYRGEYGVLAYTEDKVVASDFRGESCTSVVVCSSSRSRHS